jgi:hypothetical protein
MWIHYRNKRIKIWHTRVIEPRRQIDEDTIIESFDALKAQVTKTTWVRILLIGFENRRATFNDAI